MSVTEVNHSRHRRELFQPNENASCFRPISVDQWVSLQFNQCNAVNAAAG
jgi:hypothetical protein